MSNTILYLSTILISLVATGYNIFLVAKEYKGLKNKKKQEVSKKGQDSNVVKRYDIKIYPKKIGRLYKKRYLKKMMRRNVSRDVAVKELLEASVAFSNFVEVNKDHIFEAKQQDEMKKMIRDLEIKLNEEYN